MITKVAVLGSGTMGHGIAQLFAEYGLQVYIYDIRESALQGAAGHIRHNLELMRSESGKQVSPSDLKPIEERLCYTTDLEEAVHDAQLIVEAVPEKLDLKHQLYKRLEAWIRPDAIVASNTSTFPLEQLGEGVSFADRMLILHFFNPATIVPLVEIVKHEKTSEADLQCIRELLIRCGKVPVVLKRDIPGFIANRLQAAMLREAIHLLESGVAEACDIDAAVKHGPGLRWALHGPLETADFGGLDVWENVSSQLFPLLNDSRSAPELIQRNVREGRLGAKSGQGIYEYEDAADVMRRLEARDRQLIRLLEAKQRPIHGGEPK